MRYGLSPRRLRDVVAAQLTQYEKLCGAYETVKRNNPEALNNLGLTAERKRSAESYLLHTVSPKFSRDVVQATARALFANNLNDLNRLAALVAMNLASTESIQPGFGGNYNLIDRLLQLSEADVHLNTRVTQDQPIWPWTILSYRHRPNPPRSFINRRSRRLRCRDHRYPSSRSRE